MVFDIGDLHVKGRESSEVKQGPTSKGLDMKGQGKRQGRGREEREKKGGEQPALTIKNRFCMEFIAF